jgi:hypothetical protein
MMAEVGFGLGFAVGRLVGRGQLLAVVWLLWPYVGTAWRTDEREPTRPASKWAGR